MTVTPGIEEIAHSDPVRERRRRWGRSGATLRRARYAKLRGTAAAVGMATGSSVIIGLAAAHVIAPGANPTELLFPSALIEQVESRVADLSRALGFGRRIEFCRIGDDGTASLEALFATLGCRVDDPESLAVAALLQPSFCAVGDPGTLTTAALAEVLEKSAPDVQVAEARSAPDKDAVPLLDAEPEFGDVEPSAGATDPSGFQQAGSPGSGLPPNIGGGSGPVPQDPDEFDFAPDAPTPGRLLFGSPFVVSSSSSGAEPGPLAVPEPGTLSVFGVGAAVLLVARMLRRRRKTAVPA